MRVEAENSCVPSRQERLSGADALPDGGLKLDTEWNQQ